ncbi:CheR family methyltransferase [Candidatus Auribacterota bacterium]
MFISISTVDAARIYNSNLAPRSIDYGEKSEPSRAARILLYSDTIKEVREELKDSMCVGRSFSLANRLIEYKIHAWVMRGVEGDTEHFWVETGDGYILDSTPEGAFLTRYAVQAGTAFYIILRKDGPEFSERPAIYKTGRLVFEWGDLRLKGKAIIDRRLESDLKRDESMRKLMARSKRMIEARLAEEKGGVERVKEMLSRITEGDMLHDKVREIKVMPRALMPYFLQQARMRKMDLDEYVSFVIADKREQEKIRAVLRDSLEDSEDIHEVSWFFRDSGKYEWVRAMENYLKAVIPLKVRNGDYTIVVSGIGSATGEELYSIGMIIYQSLIDSGIKHLLIDTGSVDEKRRKVREWIDEKWLIVLEGYDRDIKVLERARIGAYGSDSLRETDGINSDYLEHMTSSMGVHRVREEIRKWYRPVYLDLSEEQMLDLLKTSRADIVFCRNLMRYIKDVQRQEPLIEKVNSEYKDFNPVLYFTDDQFGKREGVWFKFPDDTLEIVSNNKKLYAVFPHLTNALWVKLRYFAEDPAFEKDRGDIRLMRDFFDFVNTNDVLMGVIMTSNNAENLLKAYELMSSYDPADVSAALAYIEKCYEDFMGVVEELKLDEDIEALNRVQTSQ